MWADGKLHFELPRHKDALCLPSLHADIFLAKTRAHSTYQDH